MITQPLEKILFFDIETVGIEKDLESLEKNRPHLHSIFMRYIDWFKKRFPEDENLSAEEIFPIRSALIPEFAKIVSFSAGYLNKGEFKVKNMFNEDEKVLLLEIREFLDKINGLNFMLCGHNIKSFDMPMLSKRMIINGIMPPKILPNYTTKPWDVKVIDTKELWQFNNNYTLSSLDLVCAAMNVQSPKIGEVVGNNVHNIFWNSGNLTSISDYCSKDVESTFHIVKKLFELQ